MIGKISKNKDFVPSCERLEPKYMLSAAPIDAGLSQIYRTIYSDKNISRTEMIQVLRNANDGNIISVQEWQDLKNIVAKSQMPEYVKYFANSVVNGSVANNFFNGQPLGNLFGGSSASHMNKLIDKWFLGKDHPGIQKWQSNTTYQYVSGALFVDGATISDVDQGAIGDCYLINALGAVAQSSVTGIQNMFLHNGDNTWTLRFYDHRNGQPHYVTVDRYLPVDIFTGKAKFASFGSHFKNPNNELWVALAEKGYTQFVTQIPGLRPRSVNDYININGGSNKIIAYQLLGIRPTAIAMNNQQAVINSLKENKPLTIAIGRHAYTIHSYNPQTQVFKIHNPWGHSHLTLSWSQIVIKGLAHKTVWQINAKFSRSIC